MKIKNILRKMGFGIILFITAICFIIETNLACGGGSSSAATTTTVQYEVVTLVDFDSYYTTQSVNPYAATTDSYMCGFVSMHMWLKWLNKNPYEPPLRVFINWMTENNYLRYVKDDGIGYSSLMKEILNRAIRSRLVPNVSNRINVTFKNFFDETKHWMSEDNANNMLNGFFYDVSISVNQRKQPIILSFLTYKNDTSINGGHFVVLRGFNRDKNGTNSYSSMQKVFVSNGNNWTKNEMIDRKALRDWWLDEYVFDDRSPYRP